jgi:hypothetical protein
MMRGVFVLFLVCALLALYTASRCLFSGWAGMRCRDVVS